MSDQNPPFPPFRKVRKGGERTTKLARMGFQPVWHPPAGAAISNLISLNVDWY